MWRKNTFDASWEVQQAQLIRSLFADNPLPPPLPRLSTVTEEEDSSDSPSPREQSPSAQVKESSERPYSPLPPLIIEIVKTTNKHDEPKEFYKRLEKRMRRAYRRLCIENRSDFGDLSDDSSTYVASLKHSERRASFGETYYVHDSLQTDEIVDVVENNNRNESEMVNESEAQEKHATSTNDYEKRSSSTDIVPKSTTDDLELDDTNEEMRSFNTDLPKSSSNGYEYFVKEIETTEIVHLNTDEKGESIQLKRRSSKETLPRSDNVEIYEEEEEEEKDSTSESVNSETSTGSPHVGYRQITFRADVHRGAPEQIAQKAPSLVYEENIMGEETHSNNHPDENSNLAELEENDVSDAIVSSEGDNESVLSHVEVMRSARVGTSADSLQPHEDSHRNGNKARERSTSLGALKKSTPNIMEYEESIDSEVLLTSIANNENCNENVALNSLSTKKRKSPTSLHHSSPKKTRRVGTQINVDELNRKILSQNIFNGVPRIITDLCRFMSTR